MYDSLCSHSRREDLTLVLGDQNFEVRQMIGKGAHAQVFLAIQNGREDSPVALKVQKDDGLREFSLAFEIQRRVPTEVSSHFCVTRDAFVYRDERYDRTRFPPVSAL